MANHYNKVLIYNIKMSLNVEANTSETPVLVFQIVVSHNAHRASKLTKINMTEMIFSDAACSNIY